MNCLNFFVNPDSDIIPYYPIRFNNVMALRNTRRSVTEAYDPEQRIIGGIVLFILMLLIYSILKLVLGFSEVPQGKFILDPSLDKLTKSSLSGEQSQLYHMPTKFVFLDLSGVPDEEELLKVELQPQIQQSQIQQSQIQQSQIQQSQIQQPQIQSQIQPQIQPQAQSPAQTQVEDYCAIAQGKEQWYVQAASFKEEERAQRLVEKIKEQNIAKAGCIGQAPNGWYIVRLPVQSKRSIAQEQYKQLHLLLRVKGAVRKVSTKVVE